MKFSILLKIMCILFRDSVSLNVDLYARFKIHSTEPMLKKSVISKLKCVIADVICYWSVRRCNIVFTLERHYKYVNVKRG